MQSSSQGERISHLYLRRVNRRRAKHTLPARHAFATILPTRAAPSRFQRHGHCRPTASAPTLTARIPATASRSWLRSVKYQAGRDRPARRSRPHKCGRLPGPKPQNPPDKSRLRELCRHPGPCVLRSASSHNRTCHSEGAPAKASCFRDSKKGRPRNLLFYGFYACRILRAVCEGRGRRRA